MIEYSTEAVVLDKEPIGDLDALIFLYTPEQGKIVARAKSVRKITSKLASALEPATLVSARILGIPSRQIVDAISLNRHSNWRGEAESLRELTNFLTFIKEIAAEGEADTSVWQILREVLEKKPHSLRGYYHEILRISGFDTRNAKCENCRMTSPDYFVPRESVFVCKRCYELYGKGRGDFAVLLSG